MINNKKKKNLKKIIIFKKQIYKGKLKKLKEKTKVTTIKNQKKKIEKRKENLSLNITSLRKRRNLIQFSYFSRFILRKAQKNRFCFTINKDMSNESVLLIQLKYRFKKQELQNKIKMAKKKNKFSIKKLSSRNFLIGTLYLKYLRSNFFANLIWKDTSAKSSCGERYRGPKKKTMHAREIVLKKMSDIIGQNKLSTLDIQITPFGKVYRHLCRIFFRSTDIYLRYFLTPRKRSHGFTRPVKIRRT
jgi:hypothetical protein